MYKNITSFYYNTDQLSVHADGLSSSSGQPFVFRPSGLDPRQHLGRDERLQPAAPAHQHAGYGYASEYLSNCVAIR